MSARRHSLSAIAAALRDRSRACVEPHMVGSPRHKAGAGYKTPHQSQGCIHLVRAPSCPMEVHILQQEPPCLRRDLASGTLVSVAPAKQSLV